jgi:hypothetical protein
MKSFVFVCVLLAACSNGAGLKTCTLIGCNDGLNVTVTSALQQDYSVTVKSGTETLRTFTCQAGQPCFTFIDNQTPASVTVQIATNAGTVSRSYTPQYTTSRPNGPGCDPECRQATVTVNLD